MAVSVVVGSQTVSGATGLCYMNSSPSSVIANTGAETAFDQFFTYPSQSQRSTQPPTAVRIQARGILSTGLLGVGLTLALRWGGVAGVQLLNSGLVSLPASVLNAGWSLEATLLIQAIGVNGQIEAQGLARFAALTVLSLVNTSAVAVDITLAQDLAITSKWALSDSLNSIQLRTLMVEVDGP